MFILEVFNGRSWEMIAECFHCAEDAELYYNHQLGGLEDFRILSDEEFAK